MSVIARKKAQAYIEDFRREAVKPADHKGKKKLTKEQKNLPLEATELFFKKPNNK